MPSTKEALFVSGISAQRAALDGVLRSRTFAKNPRLSALLEYLCDRCFCGAAGAIKEYNIATDVFGRPPDFDQSQDAIVRVEMHRLRKKLAEFYSTEGAAEPVEIVIHSGRYLPEFVARHGEPPPAPPIPEPPPEPPSWNPEPAGVPRLPRRFAWLVIAFAAAALATTTAFLWPHHRPTASTPSRISTDPPAALIPVGKPIRILCGSTRQGIRDRQGDLWAADTFFTGGAASAIADQPVFRTRDSFLFQTARTGEFSYKIPLKPGVYEMRLYFADQSYSPGTALEGGENTRVFNVILNGEVALRDFDIMADAGPNTADVRAFKDIHPASDGYLHLTVLKANGTPLLNAIEIVPGIPHRLRPIRIVTLDSDLTDSVGVTWSRDNYFLNGRTIARTGAVTGSDDPEIYARERYGNFSYAIPVAEGRYRVTLRFAETYWGPTAPGGGGVGTRVFDVYCNGLALLRNFDMLKEAPPRTQIVKTFEHLQPNAQGKLLLSFVPVRNYANVSAIEVVDESDSRQ
jgi:Malectin domain